jgi:hypothetical protein
MYPEVESVQDLGQVSKLVKNSESTRRPPTTGNAAGYLDLLKS